MLVFNFCLLLFSKFQITIVGNLILDFKGSYEVLLSHTYFWNIHFLQWNGGLFKTFWICTEMHFDSLFFLTERRITTSLFMIQLKCTVPHYANLNSSSINKPFLNYGQLNMLLRFFFRFLIYVYFNEAIVKNFMKNLSFFETNFRNSFQEVVYYRVLGCQTLWY